MEQGRSGKRRSGREEKVKFDIYKEGRRVERPWNKSKRLLLDKVRSRDASHVATMYLPPERTATA